MIPWQTKAEYHLTCRLSRRHRGDVYLAVGEMRR